MRWVHLEKKQLWVQEMFILKGRKRLPLQFGSTQAFCWGRAGGPRDLMLQTHFLSFWRSWDHRQALALLWHRHRAWNMLPAAAALLPTLAEGPWCWQPSSQESSSQGSMSGGWHEPHTAFCPPRALLTQCHHTLVGLGTSGPARPSSVLQHQSSKNDYHPTSASGLASAGRISHLGTHERKIFLFFRQDDLSPAVWIWPDVCSAESCLE